MPKSDSGSATMPGQPSVVYGITVGSVAFSMLRGQLQWFSDRGWDVTLACTPDHEARQAVERERVNFRAIPTSREVSPLADLRCFVAWVRFLKEAQPSAVNVGTPKAGLLGGLAAWITRVPKRIYVVRGLRLEGVKFPLSAVLWLMEWLSATVATDVVVVSRSLARQMHSRRLIRSKKTWLIGNGSSNGVDAKAISRRIATVDRAALRESLGFTANDRVVGFIGRVTRDKGVDTLLAAFRDPRLTKQAKLLIIGAVEDPSIARAAQDLSGLVTVLPWTSDLWGLLPAIDILCLPTHREGFPNVVLEAAAAGIPAITTRATGAIDSVVNEKTGLLIEPDDSIALTSSINRLVQDQLLSDRLGKSAKHWVEAEFEPKLIWRGLHAIMQDDHQFSGLRRLKPVQTSSRK